ncbi:MAG: type I secretion system permease/ATPase [Aquabacterium sp.]|uniref:type I secretion system permease/ATPase n=1 Tax=Aquabacterium sp. TaxID=1872578 RepID=UPI0025C3B648|nr:type I secretion system permease/ATPase [Aquabacterium sp.]MBI3381960.1 type I secretion system permease/ATPase [Aquabacterium sp.]
MDPTSEPDLIETFEDTPEAPEQAGVGAALPADPLLEAIVWLCHHHGIDRSESSILDGFHPGEGGITAPQAVQLLKRVGFSATLVRRPPGKILSLLMPVVMLLKNGDAVILTRRISGRSKRAGGARYEVIMPGSGNEVCTATEEELLPEYSGYTLLAALKSGTVHGDREAQELSPSHWLWSTLKRYVPYYRSAMLAALLSNLLMLVTGFFTSVVYDKVIPHNAMVTLWSLGVGTLLGICFDLIARQLRSYLIDTAGKKADLIMGNMLFNQAMGIRLEHRPESAGSFAHRLSQIEIVREFSTSASASVLTDLPFVFLFILMTYVVAGPLVFVLLVAVPLILGVSLGVQRMLRRSMRANMAQHADLQGVLVEAMEGLEDVRAAGAAGYFSKRYEDANAAAAASSLRARTIASIVSNFSTVLQPLVTVVMLIWGVILIQDGQISGGSLIGAVMFAGRAVAPLTSLVALAGRYQGAKAALMVLNDLMAMPTERVPGKQYLTRRKITGQMALNDVNFAYPKGKHDHAPTVLKGINLEIQPGERIAILGKIGSGKSTILRMLAGLYQPTDGFVEVDGLDLRQIDPVDFRSHVGFVSQEPRLFYGTLKENVLLGRPNADVGHFLEVARQTGLDKLAAAHPMGYDLPVGEMGSLLSGGQRQLVALARCLVTRSQILLMDEPTSSMDAQSEAGFINHLRSAVHGQTLVVVTHRPALLDVVDRIIVVDSGKILADGPKAKVLAMLAGQKPGHVQPVPQQAPASPAGPAAPRELAAAG